MSIAVCLPASAADRLDEAIAEAMAPFWMGNGHGPPWDVWDHQDVRTGLYVLAGHDDDPRLRHEQGSDRQLGWCAAGPRELIDFTGSIEEARDLAGAAWQRWHELAAELPAALPSSHFHGNPQAPWGPDLAERAGRDYWSQPLLKAFVDYLATLPRGRYAGWFLAVPDPVTRIGGVSKAEFVDAQTASALRPWNVLTLDGWWFEDDERGLHGTCPQRLECPHRPPLAAGHQGAYLRELPGETLLVNVHCHV